MKTALVTLLSLLGLAVAGCTNTPTTGNGAAATGSPASDVATTTVSTTAVSGGSDQEHIIRAVALVKPSVVALNVTINGTQVVPPDPFSQLFGGQSAPTLRRFRAQASGSGFVYDKSGLIVTNSHVVHNSSRIQVVFANGDKIPGTLFAEDTGADLALVKVNAYPKLPPPLTLGASGQVRQGEWAIAIGEPYELQQTVTVGVVSGFNRNEAIGGGGGAAPRQFKGLMQTSAPINPGNSGGPLTDIDGRLIGVNQSTANPATGAQGIGFAIPVDAMRTTVATLIAHPGSHSGTSSGFIGVQMLPLNDNVRQQLGYTGNGVVVAGVIMGSAADHAGLNPGDVIQQINGTAVNSPDDLVAVLSKTQPGQTVHLQVWRDGGTRTVDVKVTEAPLDTGG
jgi:serine protease Do